MCLMLLQLLPFKLALFLLKQEIVLSALGMFESMVPKFSTPLLAKI
jgi:hypothetical protein